MKNIHVVATDKPSRLVKLFTNKFHLCKEILPIQDEEQYQNIYITSDEEIKEGDWNLPPSNIPVKHQGQKFKGDEPLKCWKKIILTTDQDLIKDGVQAIDDEFLEWFVKNPSCEEVDVILNETGNYREFDVSPNLLYKIIIPKYTTSNLDNEKYKDFSVAKQRAANYMSLKGALEPKQETTPEESKDLNYWRNNAEEDYLKVPISVLRYISELEKQKYSEEDMRKCWNSAYIDALSLDEETYKPLFFEDFIEEFKKR